MLMAASFVKNGDTVCDVGCDHGKLGLYLIQTGRAKKIIATDINIKPLNKAVKLFEENGLSDKRDFRLTDGLQGVENSDKKITHVVIAGMGGITMTKVFEGADFVKDESIDYVLLPAQRGFDIRKYLYENGYDITTEKTVRENLVYNMEGITDRQLEEVCRACGLDKFVHTLPQGFDTVLSESAGISAGQKQLLTIARAMLQNAPCSSLTRRLPLSIPAPSF